jgi:hypothetical protein
LLKPQEGISSWFNGDEASALASMRRCASRSALDVSWHPVTKHMSKIGYAGADCAIPVKLVSQQQKSVAAFFKPKAATGGKSKAGEKGTASEAGKEGKEGPEWGGAGGASEAGGAAGEEGTSAGAQGRRRGDSGQGQSGVGSGERRDGAGVKRGREEEGSEATREEQAWSGRKAAAERGTAASE